MSIADLQRGFQVAAAVSACLSGLVVLPTFFFESAESLKKKIFLQIIMLVSACDFIGSVGSAIGFQVTGTVACTYQSISTTFFYSASWMWTAGNCIVLHVIFNETLSIVDDTIFLM